MSYECTTLRSATALISIWPISAPTSPRNCRSHLTRPTCEPCSTMGTNEPATATIGQKSRQSNNLEPRQHGGCGCDSAFLRRGLDASGLTQLAQLRFRILGQDAGTAKQPHRNSPPVQCDYAYAKGYIKRVRLFVEPPSSMSLLGVTHLPYGQSETVSGGCPAQQVVRHITGAFVPS